MLEAQTIFPLPTAGVLTLGRVGSLPDELSFETTAPLAPASLGQLAVIEPQRESECRPSPFDLLWYDAKDSRHEWVTAERRSLQFLYKTLSQCFSMYRLAAEDVEAQARLDQLLEQPEQAIRVGRPVGDEWAWKVIRLVFGRADSKRRGGKGNLDGHDVVRQSQQRHSVWAQALVGMAQSGAVTAEDALSLLSQYGVEKLRLAHATGIHETAYDDEAEDDSSDEAQPEDTRTGYKPADDDRESDHESKALAENDYGRLSNRGELKAHSKTERKPESTERKRKPVAPKTSTCGPAADDYTRWQGTLPTENEQKKWQSDLVKTLAAVMATAGGWNTVIDGVDPEIPSLIAVYRGRAVVLDPSELDHARLIDLISLLLPQSPNG